MANDPFGDAASGPVVRLSLKPSGSYDASLVTVQGTPEELASLLKIDVAGLGPFDTLWKVTLRWNDLARAVQADEAKKAASAGKA